MRRLATLAAALALAPAALGQGLDLTQGGPVEVTANDGIEWRQAEQVVIAAGDARAVRAGVTLEADRLIARYRPRGGAQAQPAAGQGGTPLSGGEIWRMEAEGNVRIASATERARGDRAVYDLDRAVMVMTGRDLGLSTPDQTILARDSLEYWAQRRMAVARGAATVESEGRRLSADTLVGYFAEAAPSGQSPRRPAQQAAAPGGAAGAPGASAPIAPGAAAPGEGSRLERVEAFGNVEIRTADEVVRGERAVYSPVSGIARLLGNVRITRGENHLNGQEAIVNLRTGVSRLVSAPGQRVQGIVTPQGGQDLPGGTAQPQGGGR
jgi:lipopolysaccharide export system protein LptA